MKKYNQYTLENHFKILEIQTGRKIPCVIMEFLDKQYYSKSKEKYIKYKDMDITHLIRVMLNASDDVEDNRLEVIRLRKKISKLTKALED